MRSLISQSIAESIETKQRLLAQCIPSIEQCGRSLAQALSRGNKIFLCGNGGSAADAQHIAAELVVRFRGSVNRRAIPAIALTVDSSILTAAGNDFGFDHVFERGVEAYGNEGDVLIGITTSGKSPNILKAVESANSRGLHTIGLLGCGGGPLLPLCTEAVVVPSTVTARIQESHILIGHIWCEIIEEILFPELFEGETHSPA